MYLCLYVHVHVHVCIHLGVNMCVCLYLYVYRYVYLRVLQLREEHGEEQGGGGIKPGTQCKNNSCTQAYVDEASLNQDCQYHPGAPVFHEGYKYWSCCKKKKTTEFSEFLTFSGCTQGKCVFTDDPTKKKKALCRYDFFQQGPNVTVSIYAKKVDPSQCEFKISASRMKIYILFDFINTFSLDLQLAGRVRPDECKVEILGPKVCSPPQPPPVTAATTRSGVRSDSSCA